MKIGRSFDIKKILQVILRNVFNSLPNNKFLDWSNLKAFSVDKINVAEKLKFILQRVGNIVRKGENADYNVLKSPVFQGHLKSGLFGKDLKKPNDLILRLITF